MRLLLISRIRRAVPFAPALALLLASAGAARAETPEGRWLTEDGQGVIEIAPCPEGLCGRIVGMAGAGRPDTPPATDWQGRPMCHFSLLRAAQTGPGVWEGRITNPEDGTEWRCTLRMDASGRLNLRGYVLVPLLGQTQVWTRYAGALGPGCTLR